MLSSWRFCTRDPYTWEISGDFDEHGSLWFERYLGTLMNMVLCGSRDIWDFDEHGSLWFERYLGLWWTWFFVVCSLGWDIFETLMNNWWFFMYCEWECCCPFHQPRQCVHLCGAKPAYFGFASSNCVQLCRAKPAYFGFASANFNCAGSHTEHCWRRWWSKVICVLFRRYDLGEEEVLIYEYQVRCLFIFSSLRLECITRRRAHMRLELRAS